MYKKTEHKDKSCDFNNSLNNCLYITKDKNKSSFLKTESVKCKEYFLVKLLSVTEEM